MSHQARLAGTRTVVLYTDATGFGGAEAHLLSLVERLDRARFHPVVMYSPTAALDPFQERLAVLGIDTAPVAPILGVRHLGRVVRMAAQLRRIGAEVFDAHKTHPAACRFGLMAAMLGGCRAILSTDQLRPLAVPSRHRRLHLRWLAARMFGLIAVSQSVADYLVTILGIPRRQVHVIHNWVDPDDFAPGTDGNQVRRELAVADDAQVVVMVARFDEQKRHGDLVAAARSLVSRHPRLTFLLAGEGPTRARTEAEVAAARLTPFFRFLGRRRDVPRLLSAADVFVLPSEYEGFPISVLEAMAASRPVVATAVAGTAEIVRDGSTGLLVPIGDVQRLAAALDAMVGDPARRMAMGQAGRQRVSREFAAGPLVRRVEALYEAGLAR